MKAGASIVLLASVLHAQTQGFEVASIRASGAMPSIEVRNAYRQSQGPLIFDWQRSPLLGLIRLAYGLELQQIAGLEGWMRDERYDVMAKASKESSYQEGLVLLQGLLEERFELRFHWETRALPVYELTVAKGGSKMRPGVARADRKAPMTYYTRSEDYVTVATGRGAPVGDLALLLGQRLRAFDAQRILIDSTGLDGGFDFDLEFLDPSREAQPRGQALANAPGIFQAVEDTLGLRISAVDRPMRVLVVESAKRPSEN